MKLYIATPINARQEPTMREQSSSLELPSESRLAKPKKQRKQTNPKNRLSESNVKRV